MSFVEAVRSCFSQYVGFSGRSRRSEYWWFVLFNILAGMVASILDAAVGMSGPRGNGPVEVLVSLALFLPGLAVWCRRMHDIGKSGWWWLLAFIPIVGWIIMLIWAVRDSDPAPNRYGPSPKAAYGASGGYESPYSAPPGQYGQYPPPGQNPPPGQ